MSEYERQYEDGSDPSVLDIIRVPLLNPCPTGYQQENWLLDESEYWVKVGRASHRDLVQIADNDHHLWVNGQHTGAGRNDKIPLLRAQTLTSSLRLIRVNRMTLVVSSSIGGPFGYAKRRLQGRFRLRSEQYWLWVTDPLYERTYLAKHEGRYEIGPCFVTASLGEPFRGACYKLIAAIIEPWRAGE